MLAIDRESPLKHDYAHQPALAITSKVGDEFPEPARAALSSTLSKELPDSHMRGLATLARHHFVCQSAVMEWPCECNRA
jgi:hypothetical protein